MPFPILSLVKKDYRTFFADRFLRLAFVVIALVPLLYGALYLWAFWDPYSHMQDLPVAVVNEDAGYTQDGTAYHFGDTLTTSLKDSKALKWDFTSEAAAEAGLKNRTYYAEVLIPTRFSQNILSANASTPEQAGLTYTARQATGYLATQISSRVITEVVTELNTELTAGFYKTLFTEMRSSATDVQKAADGATSLTSGLATLQQGTVQVSSGVTSAKTGSATLTSGVQQLAVGSNTLLTGLQSATSGALLVSEGATSLRAGAVQFQTGLTTLSAGALSLQKGLQTLNTALPALQSGSTQVADGLNTLAPQLTSLASNLTTANTNLTTTQQGVAATLAALQQFQSAYPADSTDSTFVTAMQTLTAVQSGLTTLQSGYGQLATGATQASAAAGQLATGATQVQTGVTQVASGVQSAATGGSSLAQGVSQASTQFTALVNGSQQLSVGSSSLLTGLQQLTSGASTLSTGSASAAQGAESLHDGLTVLQSGVSQVQYGVATAAQGSATLASSLQQGASTGLAETDPATVDKKIAVLSEPVTLNDTSIDTVPNYGTGLAPYFIPLALWVGALIMFFVINVDDIKVAGTYSARELALGKFAVLAGIGTLQAVVFSTVLLLALHLHVAHLTTFYLFNILMSWSFIAILQFFISLLDLVGRFIGIVLLMLQLTSAAGTFPLETLPGFFQTFHPYLPMSYGVLGLREIISGDSTRAMLQASGVLGLFLVVFLLLLVGTLRVVHQRQGAAEAL